MRRSSFLSPMNNGFLHRRSITYCRLPQQLLKLTILKLDGSSFEVHVARTASVLELKQAVEDIFSPSPEEEDQGQISWSHVWGHFCLCFKDNKLLDDRLSMGTLGIQDGDQLHFIRHLSVNCSPIASIEEREKIADFKQQPFARYMLLKSLVRRLLTGPSIHQAESKNEECGKDDCDPKTESYLKTSESKNMIHHTELKVAHFLKEWLPFGSKRQKGWFRVSG